MGDRAAPRARAAGCSRVPVVEDKVPSLGDARGEAFGHWHRASYLDLPPNRTRLGSGGWSRILLTFLAKSAVAGFSHTSMMFSSLKMLSTPHAVTKCCAAAGRPTFMGGLSPKLYRLIPTGPPCRKRNKFWHQQNIGACKDFTDFRQTLAVCRSHNFLLTRALLNLLRKGLGRSKPAALPH